MTTHLQFAYPSSEGAVTGTAVRETRPSDNQVVIPARMATKHAVIAVDDVATRFNEALIIGQDDKRIRDEDSMSVASTSNSLFDLEEAVNHLDLEGRSEVIFIANEDKIMIEELTHKLSESERKKKSLSKIVTVSTDMVYKLALIHGLTDTVKFRHVGLTRDLVKEQLLAGDGKYAGRSEASRGTKALITKSFNSIRKIIDEAGPSIFTYNAEGVREGIDLDNPIINKITQGFGEPMTKAIVDTVGKLEDDFGEVRSTAQVIVDGESEEVVSLDKGLEMLLAALEQQTKTEHHSKKRGSARGVRSTHRQHGLYGAVGMQRAGATRDGMYVEKLQGLVACKV